MAKAELLKELQSGYSRFNFVGKAKIREGAFGGVTQKDGSTWRQVNSSFGVDSGEGNVAYGRIWGGYKTDKPIIKARNSEGKFIDVDWHKRNDEEYLKNLDLKENELYRAGIERDEDNKLIIKQFVHAIDFEEYLAEHLHDGQEIRVSGEGNYNEYNDNINLQYNVKTVFSNDPYEKDGEIKQTPYMAQLRQTYLVDSDSLDKNWERALEKDGEIIVAVYAPQYLGSKKVGDKYVPVGKNVAYRQAIKVKADTEDDTELGKKKQIIKKLFTVKKNVVREVGLIIDINEGYEESKGVELNDEMRELIEMGMLTEEDIKNQTTIRGNRISELVYNTPIVRKTDGGLVLQLEDKYAPEVLYPPIIEEDEEDTVKGMFENDDSDEGIDGISDDAFADLFGE